MLTTGGSRAWAVNQTIPFANQNRISNNGAGVFTTADNAGNQYALALADLSSIPGINTVGVVRIQFDSNIPYSSRWLIGIGDKNIRGTNANGSFKDNYNTDGLMMRFGTSDGVYYRMNGGTNNPNAFGVTVHAEITFNRIVGTYTYTLSNGGTTLFSESGVNTSVENTTIIEVYSWAKSTSIILSNVTVQFDDFYFSDPGGTKYIEDIVYTNELVNNGFSNVGYYQSDGSYWRVDGSSAYFIKTTGSEPADPTEGDPIVVTAYATNVESTRFKVRIKTRNLLVPNTMITTATNSFDVGSTLGMFSSRTVVLEGMTLFLGYETSHTPVVRSINGDYGVSIIDGNGYTFGNYDNNHEWGTVYKIVTTQAKNLMVSGYFSDTWTADVQLYDGSHNPIYGQTIVNPGNGALATGVFALEANKTYYLHQSSGYGLFALKSLSYHDPHFSQGYAVTTIGSTYTQTASNMKNPVYSIVGKQGDIASTDVTINGSTGEVSNITASGALKIQATNGTETAVYVLTVAYEATAYPGHYWDFYSVEKGLTTSDGLKEVPNPSNASTRNQTGYFGDDWVAEWKTGNKGPEWFRQRAVRGDNAFIVPETVGLIFVNNDDNFYVRNDEGIYSHVGIRGKGGGTSFTIPRLKKDDIVELMWRHESTNAGSNFTATNLKDLRGKAVEEEFQITESARRAIRRYVGAYSFIVANDGDVTFTLQDEGSNDLQSIRIYKGPYRSTMRDINLSNNSPAPITMLLDNEQQTNTYNYCNQLYSTATGPAIYVLKGYRKNNGGTLGVDYDHEGCVTGSNASKTPTFFTDEDAYPVSEIEKTRLYELRKNIVGLQMYNETWPSSNNSYNNGVIKATSGWGKVTIRLNNYTNDMKYVIGYTPDYTLTIGSAPHQTYPYTWDFTKISGGKVTGHSDNVLNSIEVEGSNSIFREAAPTNWIKSENGQYTLDTDNNRDLGSQYVPGAVLVTQDRALSYFKGVDYDDKWAKDEFEGLGFDGIITIRMDEVESGWNRSSVDDQWNSLLSFKLSDYVTFEVTGGTEEEPIGVWHYSQAVQDAGNGMIQLHHDDTDNHIDDSSIPSGGIGFRLDGGESKYIHVIPGSRLQAGDVISVTAYNAYNRDAGISFNKSASSDDVAQSKMLSGRLVEETLTYKVVANDGLDGRDDFYLYRNTNTVHITAIEISRKESAIPQLDWSIYTLTNTTITVPDLNADDKQDWIYVCATEEPESVTNATKVTDGADGPDANTNVYKYKVTAPGNSDITLVAGTKIYKIGVTHLLKDIHQVGSTGWATEIRNEDIDHELTGYFTKNDVNAYTVKYDSYDLNTATVALTPINEDGYVPKKTGIVMRLDNIAGLSKANDGKNIPLFYPSYTRSASSTPVSFPANNLMYNVDAGIESNNRNYYETISVGDVNYTKFVLTNVHWTYTFNYNTGSWSSSDEADAAGFYRLHIWDDDKDIMPAHNAFLLIPTENLPVALWNQSSSARRRNSIGIRTAWGEETTAIDGLELAPGLAKEEEKTAEAGVWYTLSGVKLPKRPTKPGLYICDGQKVSVNPRGR